MKRTFFGAVIFLVLAGTTQGGTLATWDGLTLPSGGNGGGNVSGPGSSTNAYVPQWSGTTGTSLGAGLPVGTTGASTIVQTDSGGHIAASILPQPINNTSASSDITLAVGQKAYIGASSLTSLNLYVATQGIAGEMYRVTVTARTSGSAGVNAQFYPNNTTYSNAFTCRYSTSTNSSTYTKSAIDVSPQNCAPESLTLVLYTTGNYKGAQAWYSSFDGSTNSAGFIGSSWNDTPTTWSSLGTLAFPTTWSGYVIVERIE